MIINKKCKHHKPLLVTELLFCNNPEANGKILLRFCRGNQGEPVFRATKIHNHFSTLLALRQGRKPALKEQEWTQNIKISLFNVR